MNMQEIPLRESGKKLPTEVDKREIPVRVLLTVNY